jgi:alginate O-acetyltransferase complex protein AlgI
MLFNTFSFWLFFAVVLSLFYALPFRFGRYVLLAGSYWFYMAWDWRFGSLLAFVTLVNFLAGWFLPGSSSKRKKAILWLSIGSTLGVLGFFKYYGFFASTAALFLGLPEDSWQLRIILPVGISFFTFQGLSYTIDVSRGTLRPVHSIVDFALYVAFFPQLVAGPIVRASYFLPQLADWRRPSQYKVSEGVGLILLGLVKKMVFADQFGAVADQYFSGVASNPGFFASWSGVIAFSMQIYFDFAGYTDIARGLGRVLGFHFPVNFERPYLATDIREFWHRWHISLSTWLRDYLYIPLGGNRKGKYRTYINLMITMLLGGLWHGSSWTFVFWGGFHGALLSVDRRIRSRGKGDGPFWMQSVSSRVGARIFTFLLVCIGWVFFRAQTFGDAAEILGNMAGAGGLGSGLMLSGHWILLVAGLLGMVLQERWRIFEMLLEAPDWVRGLVVAAALYILILFSYTETAIPFVYFQF